MITKPVRRLFAALVGAVLSTFVATAADLSTPVPEADVTLGKIKTIFETALMKAEFDEDGDLKIEENGVKTFVRVNKEKKLITFFSLWRLKAGVPEAKKLEFVNTLNNRLICVRFSMLKPTTLCCDYQFLYEGGITPYAILNSYRMFMKVTTGAVSAHDPDDIIGSD